MKEAVLARRAALAALVLALVLFGCSRGPQARFLDDHRVYTLAEVDANAKAQAVGAAAAVKVEDAARIRQQVLAELRQHGATAQKAAEFLTREFPVTSQSVPYYVETATVDGKPCWIVLETSGGKTGVLDRRRLWVVDRASGSIIDARAWR